MKGLMLATTVGAALLGFSEPAAAGHKHHGHDYDHHHYTHHSHHHHGVSFGVGSYPIYASPIAPIYRPPAYHDTTHYDYHPPTVYRHGSHYHVMPGHYDLHRSGHWHY
jgi:hypothetical protein